MEYFALLHLQKEPFSTSPDPEMFFNSTQHQGCLQKLELAIRLKRGLSVVIGDIGTGKSTLCRQLIQLLSKENIQILPYLILDPEFSSPLEFLTTIAKTFGLTCQTEGDSEWQIKDHIKNYLFEQTIEHQKVPVLILDEGQKLPDFCVEILREFLNFETNQFKLLQIVIFAQEEFQTMLKQKANFTDRIATFQRLLPLSFHDTRAMIDFRLQKSHTEPGPAPKLFSRAAILAIYCLTKGYPRRIVMLCSKVIIAILVNQQSQAGAMQVLRAAREDAGRSPRVGPYRVLTLTAALSIVAAVFLLPVAHQAPGPTIPPPAPPDPTVAIQAAVIPDTEQQPAAPTPIPEPAAPLPALTETTPASAAPLPANLGSVEIDPGVILSKMVARIYGRYTPEKLAMILAANPQITDPDHIRPRTMITFPTLNKTDTDAVPGQVCLELAQTTTLTEAYGIVKGYSESSPPLLIRPTMSAQNDLTFHLALQETFANEDLARDRIKDLPDEWQGQAKPSSAFNLQAPH